MKKTIWRLAFFGVLSACSCHKTPVEFQNSFSCKVNGVDWKPEGGSNAAGGIKSLNIDVGRYPLSDAINIDALKDVRDNSPTRNSIIFEGVHIETYLRINHKKILSGSGGDSFYNFKNSCTRYYPDSTANSFVFIKSVDTVQNIVKGIFQFNASSPSCKEKIVVTDGVFEVKYQ